MDSNVEVTRKVYNTPEGRAVLTSLLNDLGFFRLDLSTEQDIEKENQAKILLNKLGIWREHNVFRIVEALLNMPYTEGEN